MTKPLNLGMIGYGFMGRAHSNAYRKVGNFFDLPFRINLKAACARDGGKVKAFADQWGYESTETDWRKLVERKDIDVIDICTPNNTHCEIALAAAGAGVTGDLLAHCIDTALWLNGPLATVNAMTETFIKERKHNLTGKVEKVGIDDACAFLARFNNGSLATFESTRYARGHKALYTFEINGEHASIFWDLHDLHRLQYFDHRAEGRVRGWRSLHITDGDHPYMDKWWVPGLQIGYEHSFVHQVADFLEGVAKRKPASPTFRDALETQYVCDAVLKSARTGRWEKVRVKSRK